LDKEYILSETDLLHSDLTKNIIGASMEVHRILGSGFLENVYEEALAVEFDLRKIPYERQMAFNVVYKGRKVRQFFCDFVVYDKVIVELKAIKEISNIEQAQVLNYLKVKGFELGLLLNFGSSSLEIKRLVSSNP
jgi:GxxExxY protein